jgi:7,8-dihydropterin-6-yl-methyl-4-(beta-D-ribofuranosyl)aminobenzene 5'-phosphate synthase
MLWAMAIALAGPAAGQDARGEEKSMSDTQVIDCPATVESLVLTVVVDNVPGREDLETAWGLAVLVQGAEKTVLFDTGPDGPLLLGNLRSLGIDPSTVDAVFLSHDHRDHTGGMRTFLEANPDVTVYLLPSFSAEIKTAATSAGAEVVEVAGPLSLCPGLCTLGRLGVDITEQFLGVHTPEGLVLLTGCAHPGVENIVADARTLIGGDVLLVAGGFHLRSASPTEIDAVVAALVDLGVRNVAPSHCTGDEARQVFAATFGDHYHPSGVGTVLNLADLTR